MKEVTYKIEAPPMDWCDDAKVFKLLSKPTIQKGINRANEEYLHWEQLKYKDWVPKELSQEKEFFWQLLKLNRLIGVSITPIRDKSGHYFKVNIKKYIEFLHEVDKEMAGHLMGVSDFSESDKKQFITRNIIEEAIASSQLEGANTSRSAAKKMLLDGRKPRDNSEKMIVNNHKTMLRIEQELYKENLSLELVCELHSMITDQTIPEDKQGKLRETLNDRGERLVIKPWDDKTITYTAPDKEFVEAELPRLIDFANDKKTDEDTFIHPLIRAIMLHFWVGLLHPFEDGNGRLARILFYWYMLRHDYWAFKYLSLSGKIKKSAKQYAMAYVYSEQDDNDLTYFIQYNIDKLKLAREDFQEYIKKKIQENRSMVSFCAQNNNFNERQIKLLNYFDRQSDRRTSIVAYQNLYSVKKGTAIADLKKLVEQGFIAKKKQGRNVYYYPTKKVAKLFAIK